VKLPLLACFLLALSATACGGAADIPDTPDMRALIQNYERPTASLDAAGIQSAVDSTPNLHELAAGFQAAQYVMEDVDYASTSADHGGSRVRLQGSVGLSIRCPGNRSAPVYDERINGSLSLTLAIAENRIRRSFAGQANACVLEGTLAGQPARIVLEGQLLFDVGTDIGVGQRWTGQLLASLPGELRVGDYTFQSISGRFDQGRFQHLVQLSDGSTVVIEVSDSRFTVRDSTGVWFCDEGEPCAKQ